MELWQAGVLGVIQGISEFLPISSTGHLILAAKLLGLNSTDFLKSFEISIQMGSIVGVVFLYGRSLLLNREILKKISAAFLPTAVVGLAVYPLVKEFLLGNCVVVVAAFFIGGILLILFECMHQEKVGALESISQVSFPQALAIGFFQTLAFVPGVSRSAATILGGLFLGLQRKTIVEFSFLLAVPTLSAATGLDLLKNAHSFSLDQISFLAAGFAASFLVSIAAIKFLLNFIKTHSFIPFGVYRIVVALVFWCWFMKS